MNTAPPPDDIPGVTRRHRFSDLYHERTNFQFIKHSRRWAILSGTLIVLSLFALFARGLNFGIDFEGGTSWQVRMASGHTAHLSDVRKVLSSNGFPDAKVTILNGADGQSVNVQEHVVTDPLETVRDVLATYGAVSPSDVQFNSAETGSGGSFTFTAASSVKPDKDAINKALAATKLRDQTVSINGQSVTVSTKNLPPSPTETVATALYKYAHATRDDVSISTVGPTWGHEVSQKAIKALIYFFILLALYLSIRFEFKMAASAIVAVIHDIIFTVGVYALFHFPVTPATITAFLTILGFSLYDTVVVFDKVRENQRTLTATGRSTYSEMVNRSLNQVLMRSLSTSLVALLPVMSLLIVGSGIFGATSLEEFALALAAGLFIGSYSSIFVAAPLLAWWKEREPQYRTLAQRRARIGGPVLAGAVAGGATAPVPVAAATSSPARAGAAADDTVTEPATIGSKPTSPLGRTIQPRARQQRGRKRK